MRLMHTVATPPPAAPQRLRAPDHMDGSRARRRPQRRGRRAAVLLLLGLCAADPLGAQDVYTNPVLGRPQAVADPFVLKWNGEYYLYATGDPIRAYHSTDLVHWEEIGPVLSSSRDPDAWNQADVWAPEVVYRNGTFYLYYSATRASDDWRVGEMARRVGVAVSESPRGPFVDTGEPVTPGWGIDGHVFRDPDGGQEYLFYSYLYEPRLPGAGQVVDSLVSPFRVAGTPAHVTRGTEGWEDKDADPNNGSLRYTNEGPTVLKRNGLYYLMFSGGSWDLPTYSMAYAVSDRVVRGGLDGPGWRKVMPPILRSTPLVQAPGHNSAFKAPNNVDDLTAYHARVVPFFGPGDRETFVDRLYWIHDRLHMRPPSLGALPAPDRPAFRDLFSGPAGTLGSAWEVASGSWRLDEGRAAGSGLALPRTAPLRHYVLEANVRLPAARGAAGVAAFYAGPDHQVSVWIDAARRELRTSGVLRGRAIPDQATPLPAGFRFDAYHQLLVHNSAGRIEVTLDGVRMHARDLELGAGRVGLQARGVRAEFDGVALTPYYLDAFHSPEADWEARGGTWLVDEGALHQVAGGAGRHVALKGDPAADYEFAASVRWRDHESTASTAGVVAAATEAGDLVLAGFDRTIWPYARFWVRHVAGGQVRQTLAVELPRGFQYDVFHTIRVVKRGSAFTFYLDEQEIAAARFPVGVARPGLYTEGVRAGFDDATMKHVVVPPNPVLNGGFEAERWEPSPAAPENPWRLSGRAQINMCCAHSGIRRLLLTSSADGAEQTVDGLEPGAYTLYAWVITRNGRGHVEVLPQGGAAVRAGAEGEAWRRVAVDFEVPRGSSSATVRFGGELPDGADALVAVDDVYLFRR